MNSFLNRVRTSDMNLSFKNKVIHTLLIFFLSIILGVLSKWLDEFGYDGTILWLILNGILDLRNIFSEFSIWLFIAITISVFSKTPLRASLNVFLFFVGMTASYHLYTIYFCGFNPKNYMMIWYSITLITPILAFICWYAKGNTIISIIISSGILSFMLLSSFSIGIWYFSFKSVIDVLLFLGTILVLYVKPKNTIYSLLSGVALAYCFRLFI